MVLSGRSVVRIGRIALCVNGCPLSCLARDMWVPALIVLLKNHGSVDTTADR